MGNESFSSLAGMLDAMVANKDLVTAMSLVTKVLVVVFAILFVFQVVTTYRMIKPYFWRTVEGEVVEVDTAVINTSTRTRKHANWGRVPKITYTFEVDGQQYMSKRYSTIRADHYKASPLGLHEKMKKILDQYERGAAVTVYVNPAQPEQSIIRRHFSIWKIVWFNLVGTLLLFTVTAALMFARL